MNQSLTETAEQQPSRGPGRPPKHVNHYQAIRDHIAELMKTGNQPLNHALGKIIVRLDRIEDK